MILKKCSAAFLLALLVSKASWSQVDTLRWHKDVKLEAKRFNIDPTRINSYVDVTVHYRHWFRQNSWGKITPVLDANAVLHYNTSYLPDSTEETLRHAKLHFDLNGYHSKLLKAKVFELGNEGLSPKEALLKIDGVYLSARQEISDLQRQINEGIGVYGLEGLAAWETKVNTLISNTPEIVEVQRPSKWQLGMYVSFSQDLLYGKTGETFKNPTGGGFGFFLDVKRSRFLLDMALGGSRTKSEIDAKGHWDKGTRSNFARIDLLYGWKVIDKQYTIFPFLGYGLVEFSPAKKDKEDRRASIGHSPVIGLGIDRKFRQKHNDFEQTTWFVRASTAINPSNFIRNYAGTQINIKLVVGMMGSKLSTEMVRK